MVKYNGHIPTTELINKRCLGYYFNLDDAKEVVTDRVISLIANDAENLTQWSDHWQWIVVEEVRSGIVNDIRGKHWFEYSKTEKKFVPIELPPPWSNHIYSWGIG